MKERERWLYSRKRVYMCLLSHEILVGSLSIMQANSIIRFTIKQRRPNAKKLIINFSVTLISFDPPSVEFISVQIVIMFAYLDHM